MARFWLRSRLVLPAFATTAAFMAFTGTVFSAAAEPVVSIQRGATLEQSLHSLARAVPSVVLSETPDVERSLENELREVSVEAALLEISRSFHLHCVRRPGSISLQRRYADPREVPRIEVEELVDTTSDLHRLVGAVGSAPIDMSAITDQRDFYRSLSGKQLEAMQVPGRGLPLGALGPDQQRLWRRINLRQAYGTANMDWERAARAFSAWKRTALTRDARKGEHHEYPDPANPRGVSRIVDFADGMVSPFRLRTLGPSTEHLAERRRLPAAFSKRGPAVDGGVTLSKLVRLLERTSERTISFPTYAGARQLLAFNGDLPAQNVVAGLEDLYGWTFTYERDNRYSLGRPQLAVATDFYDLHRKLKAAVPPPFHRAWSDEGERARDTRFLQQRALVLNEVVKLKGPDWRRVEIRELDSATERRLANALFDRYVRPSMFHVIRRDQPFAWISEPERGYFILEGEAGPDKKPLILFNVPRADGKTDSWGWFVGTSSLD